MTNKKSKKGGLTSKTEFVAEKTPYRAPKVNIEGLGKTDNELVKQEISRYLSALARTRMGGKSQDAYEAPKIKIKNLSEEDNAYLNKQLEEQLHSAVDEAAEEGHVVALEPGSITAITVGSVVAGTASAIVGTIVSKKIDDGGDDDDDGPDDPKDPEPEEPETPEGD